MAKLSWTLSIPTPSAPPSPSLVPYPVGASRNQCSASYFTQADFLSLFARLLPENYLQPMQTGQGPGYELLQAWAELFERVSLAVGRLECGAFYTLSHGGEKSLVVVEFFRETATAGAVTVKAGTMVTASGGGQQFVTLEDAVFGALAVGPIAVDAEAVAEGWEWNVPGRVVGAGGDVMDGEINTVERPYYDPPYGDPNIQVRQLVPASGGMAAMLDGLGDNRGLKRNSGESDTSYSGRCRSLPDTVTPDALQRLLARTLDPLGITWTFIETFQIDYQTAWDAPSAVIPANPEYDPNLWAYDDPRDPVPFRGRWLAVEDYRGAFLVVLGNLAPVLDVGMAYDDPAVTLTDYAGKRAHSAYDVATTGFNVGILQGGYDGWDVQLAQTLRQLWSALDAAKAGGVTFAIEREGQ